MIKVHYVPSRKITREYRLIRQGLENNRRIELVDNEEESDFVFLFYTVFKHNHDYIPASPPNKIVFLDYMDKPHRVWSVGRKYLAYFKRSWVEEIYAGNYTTKRVIPRPSNFHPLTMAIMDEFIIDEDLGRDIVLTCVIRPHKRHPNRPRTLNFIKGMNIQGKTQIGKFNEGRSRWFNNEEMREYFRLLKRSRIVVTCNPGRWEGDHRTWEAFANGALVFVDRMYTPMIHPLIDGKHCIFYDLSDKGLEQLRKKILYFLQETDHADDIARAGHEFTMRYHRTMNRIDEILAVIT